MCVNSLRCTVSVALTKKDAVLFAIFKILTLSMCFNQIGLVKGLNEVCKCLDRKEAILCILAENCDDPKYKKLVTVSLSSPF